MQGAHHPVQFRDALAQAEGADRFHLGKRTPELHHLAGQDLARRGAGNDALQVADVAEMLLQMQQVVGALDEVLDDVVTGVQLVQVEDGHRQGGPQLAGAHRRRAMVDHVHERRALGARRGRENLQVADREAVHPDELGPIHAGNRANVAQARVLRLLQIDEQGAGGADAQRAAVDGEALERAHAQLLLQLLDGGVLDEGPLVEGADVGVRADAFPHDVLRTAGDDDLLRGEGGKQGSDIVDAALGDLESARGHVQEGGAAAFAVETEAGEEVVFLLRKHLLAESHAGGHDLRDAALDEGLGQFRVLELVADGHLIAGAHELGQVDVDGMVGDAGHGDGVGRDAGALREHDAEDLAGRDGVVAVGFIEVPAAEEQHGLGALGLEGEVLLHHRGHRIFFLTLRHRPQI